ncbi:hypothetical protein CARUB_v10002800mg [Capsella rubella]|uniref:C2H2-type domain-containing protein n=1 Tax=Capsella rubella TaxID=81985 RepID=R0GZ56_9BRAS|nr:uncharacterized protein LOC17881949 [Capsella rubella]EOA22214.1 hypothetical protein CARUB_v10002800mg [Capsella rubella]
MNSFPNGLNSYGDDTMNNRRFTPIEMNSNFRNYESKMVESRFITSGHTNHHGLFSSSSLSSSSFGLNNPQVAYQMRQNMVSRFEMPCITQVPNNPHLSQISVTQTITNRYSAIIPTHNLVTSQNAYRRAMNHNIFNSSFYPTNFVEKQCEILNPTPLRTVFPHQTSVYPRQPNRFSFSPEHHHDQHVSNRRPVKKRCRSTRYFEENFEGFDSEESGEYDGRTHSLPYKKYGPYTCPKCNNVFDTSQKFAAHMSSVHYKNETIDEKFKRYKARNKKRLCKTNQMSHEESHNIQPEERVVEQGGGNDNTASDPEAFQHHMIVKEEPV